MIIGKFSSYITNPCKAPDSSSRYYRYINSAHGRQIIGYGSSCEAARQDWYRLVDRGETRLPPAKGGTGGGLSANSVQQARGNPVYQPKTVSTKGNWVSGGGTSGNSVKQAQGGAGVGLGASGSSSGAGVSGGASIKASVSDLQTKVNQTVSDIIPDSIEDKLPENFPLWILPVGLVGGLVLILLMRR